MADIKINGARLGDSLMEMGRIGATPGGGVGRLALTDLDKQAPDLFVRWCEEAGCTLRIDRMGNIFARRAGRDDSLPPVMTGSHLDTQPLGGKFDGNYGVLAGLEVVCTRGVAPRMAAGYQTAADAIFQGWRPQRVVIQVGFFGSL